MGFTAFGTDAAPAAYTTARRDVASLVPSGAGRVLDIGCATGAFGAALRRRDRHVTGIEVNPDWSQRASEVLDDVLTADVEVLAAHDTDVAGAPFDCIVVADVLEHLRDPWAVVRWAAGQLTATGVLIGSVPNIRHAQLIARLLLGRRWPYDDVGIFDHTHLRWFAHGNVAELLEGSGLVLTRLERTFALSVGPGGRLAGWANAHLAPHLGDFGTLQFLFSAAPAAPTRG